MRKRAKFNLSNFHNCTMKMGQLYPTHLQEVLPGDTIQMNSSVFMRFAPMVAPVMHPTHMFMHYFYVPSRVLANFLRTGVPFNKNVTSIDFDFERFITGGPTGEDTQTIPTIRVEQGWSGLPDAFGIPTQNIQQGMGLNVNLLPILAYYMIYDEYYRDQDLQEKYGIANAAVGGGKTLPSLVRWLDGSDTATRVNDLPLLSPCWSKDYFTTARPWPQKGPEVTVPVQGVGGITGTVKLTPTGEPKLTWINNGDNAPLPSSETEYDNLLLTDRSGDNNKPPFSLWAVHDAHSAGGSGLGKREKLKWADPGLAAAFESTTPGGLGHIDINDLREAFAIQKFEEQQALYGSRYEDLLRSLGVRPQDARLQLPEYLGGFTSPVQFSEVLQTSAGENGGVGDLYGHGIAAARGRRIRRFIPEHGYIMGIMCVRPIPVYSQGVERLWTKSTKYDFWTKQLEHIGQQEVLNSEVFADGSTDDTKTFGYQNRYDEYRRGVNVITGEFRTNQDFWTLARIFDNRPALNADFVECNPSDRIFQVGEQNSDQLYCMVKNNIIAKRLVSKNGNPI